MKIYKILAIAVILFSTPAFAQFVRIIPVPSLQPNASGTIATTNTFQIIQVNTPSRIGCTIQNNGTHNMYIYFGPIANATTSNSFILTPGNGINCQLDSTNILQDQVNITGTSGDSFSANFQ